MTIERSESEALSGVLRLQLGGSERTIPTLKLKHSREWKEQAARLLVGIDIEDTTDMGRWVASLASVASDTMLDLVLAYDRTNALGGRDWIEEHVDERELYAAVEAMVTATFPFVTDSRLHSVAGGFGPQIRAALGAVLLRVAQPSPESSTSGRSARGASTPTPLKRVSRTSSSSSSGATAKSA